MKIAYHHRTRGRGAQGIHIREIADAFKKLGHQVEILSLTNKNPGESGSLNNDSMQQNIYKKQVSKLLKKWFTFFYTLPGYFYLTQKCREEKVDFIYERYSLYNYAGVKAAEKLDIPLVLEVNSPYAHKIEEYEKPLFHPLAKKMERKIIKSADIVITVSESLKNFLGDLGIDKEKITVMHNGVDYNKFDYRLTGEEIRQQYNLVNKKVIGFIGGLEQHHGLETLFKAVSKLDTRDEIALLLVGSGSYQSELEQLAEQLNLEVVFSGRIAHQKVPNYLAVMDIAVKPDANFYCSPMKLFEYMAMKKPIIAGYNDSISEIINPKRNNGLLVEADVNGLKAGIEKLLTKPNLAKKLAENAYDYVTENYSWQKNAKQVIDLVKNL